MSVFRAKTAEMHYPRPFEEKAQGRGNRDECPDSAHAESEGVTYARDMNSSRSRVLGKPKPQVVS